MTVGIFTSHDTGFAELIGEDDWISDAYYAMLCTTGQTIDRAAHTQKSHATNQLAVAGDYDHEALASKAIAVNATRVRFDCAKIDFGAAVSLEARYLFIIKGTAASPNDTDPIVGHIDLQTEGGNVESVAAEFSFDPAATNGLFEVERTAA